MSVQGILKVYDGQEPDLCFGAAPGPGGVNSVGVGAGLTQTGSAANPIVNLGMTAVGDILVGSGVNTGAVLGKGANGTFLRVKTDGSGLEYAAVAPGGVDSVTGGSLVDITFPTNPEDPQVNLAFTAKGDLLVGTGANTGVILPIPATADLVLVSDPNEVSGMKWEAQGSGSAPIINRNLSHANPKSIDAPSSANDTMITVTEEGASFEWNTVAGFNGLSQASVIGFTAGQVGPPTVPVKEYTGTIVGSTLAAPQPTFVNGTMIEISGTASKFYVYWKYPSLQPPPASPFVLNDPARISGFIHFTHAGADRSEMYVYGSFNRIAQLDGTGAIDPTTEKVCWCFAIINDETDTISDLVDINGIIGVGINDVAVPFHDMVITSASINRFENPGVLQPFITFVGNFNCYVTGADVLGVAGEVNNVSQFFINDILGPPNQYEFKTAAFLLSENIGVQLGAGDFLSFVYHLELQGNDYGFFIGGKFTQVGIGAGLIASPSGNLAFAGGGGLLVAYLPISGGPVATELAGFGESLTADTLCVYGTNPTVYTAYCDYTASLVNAPGVPAPPTLTVFTLPGSLAGLNSNIGNMIGGITLIQAPPNPATAVYDIIGLQSGTTTIYYRNDGGAPSPAWALLLSDPNPAQNIGLNGGSGLITVPASLGTYGLVANYTTDPNTIPPLTTFRELFASSGTADFILSSGKFRFVGPPSTNFTTGFGTAKLTDYASQSYIASSNALDWIPIGAINPGVSFV